MSSPTSNPSVRNGKAALVTGAAKRIGRAIALELAQGGHDIAVHYRSSADEARDTCAAIEALGARAMPVQADLMDEAACVAMVPQVVATLGRLDVVVNSASTFEYDEVDSFGHAAMERHWRANTAPAVLLARGLHRHLVQRSARGVVVNLLDQKLANPNPDYFSYTLSKAALDSATTMLAMALSPVLRVAGVAPGITLPSDLMSDVEFAAAQAMTPSGHSASAEDVARAVRFIVESTAVNGCTLYVDGGQHLMKQPRDVLFAARALSAGRRSPT